MVDVNNDILFFQFLSKFILTHNNSKFVTLANDFTFNTIQKIYKLFEQAQDTIFFILLRNSGIPS